MFNSEGVGRLMRRGFQILVAAGLVSIPLISIAEMSDERHVERMQVELKLSPQQSEEVRKIFADVRPQLEALRKQRQELREKTRERLKAVLTADQIKQFDRIHEERKADRKRRRHSSQ